MDIYKRIEKALMAGHMVVARVERSNGVGNRVRILKGSKCSYSMDFRRIGFIESCFIYGETSIHIMIKAMRHYDKSMELKIKQIEVVKD